MFYLRNKTSAAVLQSLQQFRAELRRHDPTYELCEVRTDGAKEYDSHEARAWYDKKGVVHTSGAPYTPNQTLCGVSSRASSAPIHRIPAWTKLSGRTPCTRLSRCGT